jgi:hypothetical protein
MTAVDGSTGAALDSGSGSLDFRWELDGVGSRGFLPLRANELVNQANDAMPQLTT